MAILSEPVKTGKGRKRHHVPDKAPEKSFLKDIDTNYGVNDRFPVLADLIESVLKPQIRLKLFGRIC